MANDMTEETQALVAEWGEAVYLAREDHTVDPHQHIERLVQRGDYLVDALTTLARDLETARQALADLTAKPICLLRDYEAMRQERDAALANCKNWWKLRAELAIKQNDTLRAERDAAVRAARAETWADAALLAGQSAAAIRHMRQAFVASPVMGELAVVRAEALEQFAKGLHERATAAREGQ